jgi:lipopolysaccharide/colanic/teichoic acid biosynthesis glycosyltransferase
MAVTVKTFRFRILLADLCWAVAASALSYGLRYENEWQSATRLPFQDFIPFLLFTLLFWVALSSWVHLDGFRGGWRFAAIFSQLFPAVAALMVLLFAGAYLTRWNMSRLILNVFGISFFAGLLAVRLIARAALASRYRSGAVRKAVIVGTGPIAMEIARKIESHPEMLWEVAGFLYPAENAQSFASSSISAEAISVRSVGVAEMLRSHAIDDLILAVSRQDHPEISDLVARCLHHGIAVSVVPQPYELYLSRPRLLDLDGLPLLKLEGIQPDQRTPIWKQLLDLAVATCLLLIGGLPVLTVAAWFRIKRGKGFATEIRCGQFGKPFNMYRLNSERDAVGVSVAEFLMQQTSFTELPQVLNVLRGEMSLVGPRPEGPEKVRHYSDWHRRRLSVKPGITGLAQVHGLRDQNSSEDKTAYDLQYVLHRSLFLDISLLLQTLWTLVWRSFQQPLRKRSSAFRSDVQPQPHISAVFEENLSSAHSSQSGTD